MASPFTWNDTYSVKINAIDLQHKKLFSLIDELHNAMMTGKASDIMGKTLAGLVDYTKTHFKDEEAMLTKVKYPDIVKHKGIHDELVKKATEFEQKFKSGKLTISIEILQFLGDWIKNHIMNKDQQYATFIASKGGIH